MFKKIFTYCGLLILASSTMGTLSSCSSSAPEEENAAGVMTLSDFSSARDRFLVRNDFGRFFFVSSDGAGPSGIPTASNQVLLTGSINVDGEVFPVSMIYATDEQQQPDGIPTLATLSLTLLNTDDASDFDLISAVFGEPGGNPSIAGEPILFNINFETREGVLQSTAEYDTFYTNSEGTVVLGRDTYEANQPIEISVIPVTVELP